MCWFNIEDQYMFNIKSHKNIETPISCFDDSNLTVTNVLQKDILNLMKVKILILI